ncbi:Nucleotide-binding universal stress protein, UspA family [Geodermatophilus obscurus]|uniref:Nucleotide-binding universal stress protein, UspA family n=1 Tax=Geodermatophilus obscurus TaxID=1861 RepID=A0A1M7SP71_9ACTN|nr:universal stress protein [Geodermatophilus obscurus]SHN60313.1 Nucleotide-binding universal stress protein, UspA family [Geodermatophilus obscurus]
MDEVVTTDEVVVGVDGSDGARTALAWGLREAQLRGAAVRPVTVWPEDQPPHAHEGGIGRPSIADFEQDVRSRMSAEAAEVAAATGCQAVPVRPEVRYGQSAQQLVDTAGGGLLVLGSRGRGGLRGAVLGSVSQQCAQHARGPVVVVRDDPTTHGAVLWQGTASRVLVGVDGSAGSVAALRFAAAEARLRGGELHVVHAWTDTVSGYGGAPWARPVTTLREEADTTLRQSLQDAWRNGSPGVQVRAETIEGVEWDVLTEVADAADLLVVGSRGRTGWSSLLLGSVSLRCITYAPCPVAVVRASRAEG